MKRSGWILVGIAVTFTLWRLILACTLGLGDDEGYYWDWQNHLSLSYFDHPPLVAWLIFVAQSIFPKAVWSVRLPFITLSLVSVFSFYRLAVAVGTTRPWLNTVLLFVFIPIFSFGGFMAFPDYPLLAAWIWALLITTRLESRPQSTNLWLQLGLACGFALLSKLTALLLLGSIVIWALAEERIRRQLSRPMPWLALLLAIGLATPILIWNIRFGFPTFRFQLLERHSSGGLSFSRWLQFLIAQVLLVSPLGFFLFGRVLLKSHRNRIWLLSFTLPTALVFFLQPLKANFQPHWPAPAFLPALALIQWPEGRSFKINFLYLASVNLLFLMIFSYPTMEWLNPRLHLVSDWKPNYDFSNDLHGWEEAGPWVRRLAEEVHQRRGQAPYLLTSRYQLAGNLSFYSDLPASAYGDRANAYRYFADSPYHRDLSQTPILFVADNRYTHGPENGLNCRELDQLKTFREGYEARSFRAWECTGFTGR